MNPASWGWIFIAAFLAIFATAFDMWAHFTGNQSLSGRFHEWLHGPITGPLIVGLGSGLLIGLVFHLITTQNQ